MARDLTKREWAALRLLKRSERRTPAQTKKLLDVASREFNVKVTVLRRLLEEA